MVRNDGRMRIERSKRDASKGRRGVCRPRRAALLSRMRALQPADRAFCLTLSRESVGMKVRDGLKN